jgi:hypothetical protein
MTTSSAGLPLAEDADFLGDPGEDLFDSLLRQGPDGGPGRVAGGSAAVEVVADFIARRRLDSILGWLLILTGGVLLSIGYFQVSSTPKVQDQLVYLSAQTAFGMFCALTGAVLIISRHFQNFTTELQRTRQAHHRADPAAPSAPDA